MIRDVESKERGGDAQASSWQAAAGMRINAVLVDELEDGELEEDIEGTDDVRASHNIDNLHVRCIHGTLMK